jgi:hypothetical protein
LERGVRSWRRERGLYEFGSLFLPFLIELYLQKIALTLTKGEARRRGVL